MTITAKALQEEFSIDARTFYRLLGYMNWQEAAATRKKEFSEEEAKEIRFAEQMRKSGSDGVQKVKAHYQSNTDETNREQQSSKAHYDPTDSSQNPFYDTAYKVVRHQQKTALDMAYYAVLHDGSFFEDMQESSARFKEARQQQINSYAKTFVPPELNLDGSDPVDMVSLLEGQAEETETLPDDDQGSDRDYDDDDNDQEE
jgi:hypothetical protein